MKFKEFLDPKRGGDDPSHIVLYAHQLVIQTRAYLYLIDAMVSDNADEVFYACTESIVLLDKDVQEAAKNLFIDLPKMLPTKDDPDLRTLSRRTQEIDLLIRLSKPWAGKNAWIFNIYAGAKVLESKMSKLYEYCRKNKLLR